MGALLHLWAADSKPGGGDSWSESKGDVCGVTIGNLTCWWEHSSGVAAFSVSLSLADRWTVHLGLELGSSSAALVKLLGCRGM